MKFREILVEWPYVHDGKFTGGGVRSGTELFISNQTLHRQYTTIGVFELEGKKVTFSLHDTALNVVATYPAIDPTFNEQRNLVILSLHFKQQPTIKNYPSDIPKDRTLQVDSVAVVPQRQGRGLASFAYASLIKQGYVVVSDSAQFTDGKELWKRMARAAGAGGYSIHLIDDDTGYLTDSTGAVITYNASNVDDAVIWTSGQNYGGYHILLIMR